MKSYGIIIALIIVVAPTFSFSQSGKWIWMKGDSTANAPAIYGTKGQADINNTPGGRYEAARWADLNGNFWLLGGSNAGALTKNDLWQYDVNSNQWTWMSGDSVDASMGNYGIQGVPSINNAPAARGYGVTTWTDLSGNLWLFGGGSPAAHLNDLWKYDPISNEWTWMKGSPFSQYEYHYGTKGIPDPLNKPPSNYECPASWMDNDGDLWLYH
ncbi:MAG: kelch repeat-containing protein, partial [Chitinophagales bacterium]